MQDWMGGRMDENGTSGRGDTSSGAGNVHQQVILSAAKNLSEEPTLLTQRAPITAPGALRDSSLPLRMTPLGQRVRETPRPCHFGLHPFRGARLTPCARGFVALGPPRARDTTFDPLQTCVGGMSPSRDVRSRERRGVGTRRPHTGFGRLAPVRRSAGRTSLRATAAGARSYSLSFRAKAASRRPQPRNLASDAGRRAAAHSWPPQRDSSARLRLARNDKMVRPIAHGTRRPPSNAPFFHPSNLPLFHPSIFPPSAGLRSSRHE